VDIRQLSLFGFSEPEEVQEEVVFSKTVQNKLIATMAEAIVDIYTKQENKQENSDE
jgi:hypothetical protein